MRQRFGAVEPEHRGVHGDRRIVSGRQTEPASRVLGRKLDSIPFSPYHAAIIAVLGLVGFADGYDLVMTGSLLVLAKAPLQMAPEQIRFLAVAST